MCDYAELMDKLQDPNNLRAHFIMGAHIDMRESWSQGTVACTAFDGANAARADCEGWEPVGNLGSMMAVNCSGTGASCFSGTFNGRGYRISNLWINRDDSVMGFFGAADNAISIRNVALVDVNIRGGTGTNTLGGLLGLQSGGSITDSYVTGDMDGGAGNDKLGGLVGEQNDGEISKSYATSNVNGGANNDKLGGLVGEQNDGEISKSYATGNVNGGANDNSLGGLVGEQNDGEISRSYATGNVDGGAGNDNPGGLVGYQIGGNIANSYALGDVSGAAGFNSIGGLVGFQTGGNIANSYATGDVDGIFGSGAVGGLVGWQFVGGNLTNTYAAGDMNTSTSSFRGGLIGDRAGGMTGTHYSVYNLGVNGVGNNGCGGATCVGASNLQTISSVLFDPAVMNWPQTEWQKRDNAHPCIIGIDFGRGGCPP